MIYGYFLEREKQSDVQQIKKQLLDFGVDCFLSDSDNLECNYPKWQTLMNFLTKGDKLIVSELNDIFLSPSKLFQLFNDFIKKGIQFLSIKENFGFNQGCHKLFDVLTIYKKFKKNYYGEIQRKKWRLSKLNGEIRKPRREMSDQVTNIALIVGKRYLNRDKVQDILKEHGLSSFTFYNYLDHVGIDRGRDRGGNLPGFEDDEPIIENMVILYNQGKSVAKIHTHYPSLSRSKIERILKREGVEMRGKGKGKLNY